MCAPKTLSTKLEVQRKVIMKQIAISLFIGMIIGLSTVVSGGETTGPADTVQQFFMASKSGEIETMRNLITGPFFNRRKALIERNPGYSDFLKKQLEGVEMEIVSTEIGNDGSSAFVMVRRLYPNGSSFDTRFSLKKGENDTWKIFDERLVQ